MSQCVESLRTIKIVKNMTEQRLNWLATCHKSQLERLNKQAQKSVLNDGKWSKAILREGWSRAKPH